jgi:uncharacterized protein (TIGR03083 family)
MPDAETVLRSSIDRLTSLVEPLDEEGVTQPAYPSEWTIADVLSHLGSGAVIFRRRLDDALADRVIPEDFARSVWDEWTAKSPRPKTDDGLAAIHMLSDRLDQVSDEDRASVAVSLGPLNFDWEGFLRTRVSEQILHEWDVAVALDPATTLPNEGIQIAIDNLDLVTRFTAKPQTVARTVGITTTDPDREFAVAIEPQSVVFTADSTAGQTDLTMPAEAFIRLVYGRLDPDHTPTAVTGDESALDVLRAVFPGP